MRSSTLENFRRKVLTELKYLRLPHDTEIEYELRFGRKINGKFTPELPDSVRVRLVEELDALYTKHDERTQNVMYANNIRKIVDKTTGSERLECKKVIKKIDWLLDGGLCLRFAISCEVKMNADIDIGDSIMIRNKDRAIYKLKSAEVHVTNVYSDSKSNYELEIEYKDPKTMDLNIIERILGYF